ncbi:hypothetical protein, partial [Paenibacillus thiaminolyticus]|uniref:hypothetical protein n=1 Tax=Paenibacillus thiaminolyticus TaxID=49283 RepID=UPI002281E0C6
FLLKTWSHSVLNRFFLRRDEIHHIKNKVLKIPPHFLNSLMFAGFFYWRGGTGNKTAILQVLGEFAQG